MARRPYVHLAGDLSGWPKGTVPTPGRLRNLDRNSTELVNGDDGGTWSPEDPIAIGPYGTPTITLGTVGSTLSGDVQTAQGNSLGQEVDSPVGLVLQSGAMPIFENSRTRDVVVPFGFFQESRSSAAGILPDSLYYIDPLTFGAKHVAGSSSEADILTLALPLRAQHRGATISSVDFWFIVPGSWSVNPGTNGIRVRVAQISGNTMTSLHSASAGGYDANGYLLDPLNAGTLQQFTNNGQPRAITFVPDQNNTNIDPSSTAFIVNFRCPSSIAPYGSFADGIVLSAVVHLTSIADLKQE